MARQAAPQQGEEAPQWRGDGDIPGKLSASSNRLQIAVQVGRELYNMLIKPYTKKQWAKYPSQLDAEVFTRLPYREDRDDRYTNARSSE